MGGALDWVVGPGAAPSQPRCLLVVCVDCLQTLQLDQRVLVIPPGQECAGARGGLGLGLWLCFGLGCGTGRGWVGRTAEKTAARGPPLPRCCAAPAPRRGPRSSRVPQAAAPAARGRGLAAAAPPPSHAAAPPRPAMRHASMHRPVRRAAPALRPPFMECVRACCVRACCVRACVRACQARRAWASVAARAASAIRRCSCQRLSSSCRLCSGSEVQ